MYLDDVPIQVRAIGFSAGTVFPVLFDLERVEVLRGPQGTLFGSGSQGGTVRFIQPAPSLERYSVYARAEGAITPHADESYEGGVAVGGPIVEDKLGFRVSAFYRREGGWIDSVPATFNVVDPVGASYADSLVFTPTGKGDKNHNYVESKSFRAALKMAPTENFTISPSIFYQETERGGQSNNFWTSASDPGSGPSWSPSSAPGRSRRPPA